MSALKKRIEAIERLVGKPGRLIVVAADSLEGVNFRIAAECIDRRPTDTVMRIPRAVTSTPLVQIYEAGLTHLLAGLDGNSKPLVKEVM